MNPVRPVIVATGLVTSVGLNAAASCAAIRAKISNPTPTQFVDTEGRRIMAHQVELERPWRGLPKLAKMAALAAREALSGIPHDRWRDVPMLLCVAHPGRAGRPQGLDDLLFGMLEAEMGNRFAAGSALIADGSVGVAVAAHAARNMIAAGASAPVLVVATDSLLNWPCLSHLNLTNRLLTENNSNGFMPGEGAGALLIDRAATTNEAGLSIHGLGFATEEATVDGEAPLRATGLAQAIRHAVAEAAVGVGDLDYRVSDIAGEQYHFKEASIAMSRVLRKLKTDFPMIHPAESIGHAGAAIGTVALAAAHAATVKGYAPGPGALIHYSGDHGRRAAMVVMP